MTFRAIDPAALEWITRPHEPGAAGRRHRHPFQEETFVVLSGELTMYLGDPPSRVDARAGGLIHVPPGTPLQTVNHGDADLLVRVASRRSWLSKRRVRLARG